MKARERERAAALRMVVDSLQQDAKLGTVTRWRCCSASARSGWRPRRPTREPVACEQASQERSESELIEVYLPAAALRSGIGGADRLQLLAETGASEARQIGEVMSALMPKLAGRADGKRVSAAVRERLGA